MKVIHINTMDSAKEIYLEPPLTSFISMIINVRSYNCLNVNHIVFTMNFKDCAIHLVLLCTIAALARFLIFSHYKAVTNLNVVRQKRTPDMKRFQIIYLQLCCTIRASFTNMTQSYSHTWSHKTVSSFITRYLCLLAKF